jgi:hypothetical protein
LFWYCSEGDRICFETVAKGTEFFFFFFRRGQYLFSSGREGDTICFFLFFKLNQVCRFILINTDRETYLRKLISGKIHLSFLGASMFQNALFR